MVIQIMMNFITRLLPGMLIIILFLLVIPKKNLEFRIITYILLFILMRDTMTPLKLWSFGSEGLFWIRFSDNGLILIILGIFSMLAVIAMNLFDKDLARLIVWNRGNPFKSIIYGLIGALVVVTPFIAAYRNIPISLRGGAILPALWIPTLITSMLGNLYEEVLFRGYFQGYMERTVDPLKAWLLSGILFALGHVFLATTVTNVGLPLILFTLYEGLAAAFVRMKHGVIGATITHGFAIYILASGLV